MYSSDEYPWPIPLNPNGFLPSFLLWLTSVVLPITSLTDIQKLNFLHFGVLYSLEIYLFFSFFALFLLFLAHNYVSFLASLLSDTGRLICLLKWSVYEVTAFLGYFGNARVCNVYLRIYCCIGSASRKWTAFLLYSSSAHGKRRRNVLFTFFSTLPKNFATP